MTGSKVQRQRLNPRVEERRRAILRTLMSIEGGDGREAFDVWRATGTEGARPGMNTIASDLRWLRGQGYAASSSGGGMQPVYFVSTEAGRAWAS